MATIKCSYDTKTKKLTCSMNGQPLSNISDVTFYRYEWENKDGEMEDEAHVEITMREMMDKDNIAKTTRLYASKTKEGAVSIDELETYANNEAKRFCEAASNWIVNAYGK